jgi:hypothetical protein
MPGDFTEYYDLEAEPERFTDYQAGSDGVEMRTSSQLSTFLTQRCPSLAGRGAGLESRGGRGEGGGREMSLHCDFYAVVLSLQRRARVGPNLAVPARPALKAL